jgi:hypothetical protein
VKLVVSQEDRAPSSRHWRRGLRFDFGGLLFALEIPGATNAFFDFIRLFAHITDFTLPTCFGCLATMKFRAVRFNTYYYLWLLLSLTLGIGCHTDAGQKKAPKKGFSVLRLHIETNLDGTDKNGPVMVGRQTPFSLTVNKLPFIEETHLGKVSLVDDATGGFALRVQLNRQGTWLLEQYTVANKGRRIAVFAELEDFHWIAAWLITQRISDGVFTFSPDITRDDAEKLVLGLNKKIKKIRSTNSLNDPEVK